MKGKQDICEEMGILGAFGLQFQPDWNKQQGGNA